MCFPSGTALLTAHGTVVCNTDSRKLAILLRYLKVHIFKFSVLPVFVLCTACDDDWSPLLFFLVVASYSSTNSRINVLSTLGICVFTSFGYVVFTFWCLLRCLPLCNVYLCVSVPEHMPWCVRGGGRTDYAGNSLFSPYGSWGWTLGCQVIGSFYPLRCLPRPRFS